MMARAACSGAAAAALARSSRAALGALGAHTPCTPVAHHPPLHRSGVPAGARSVTNLLSVAGLPARTEPEQVRGLFEKFGDLEEVRPWIKETPPTTQPRARALSTSLTTTTTTATTAAATAAAT